MNPEATISLGNAVLFTAAILGIIASFARPIRSPYDPDRRWDLWNLSLLSFAGYLWILLLVILFAPILGEVLTRLVVPDSAIGPQSLSIGATVVMQVGLVAIILGAAHRRGWSLKHFFQKKEVGWRRAILHSGHLFLRYLPLVWLVSIFWAGLLLILVEMGIGSPPAPQLAVQWIAESDSALFLVIMGLMVVFAAPISEELVFRGFLYRFLDERGPARFALIFSSLLFALLHASLHSFLPLFFIGLLLVKVYDDTRDIRIPILFHLYFNLFSFLNLLFLP